MSIVYLMPLDRIGDQPLSIPVTDPQGAFTMPQVAPGAYRAFALDRWRPEPLEDSNFIKPYESQVKTIRVVSEQKLQLQLPLITPAE